MTVKELREKLLQFDDDLEVGVYCNDGFWDECNTFTIVTADEDYIEEDFLLLESH